MLIQIIYQLFNNCYIFFEKFLMFSFKTNNYLIITYYFSKIIYPINKVFKHIYKYLIIYILL